MAVVSEICTFLDREADASYPQNAFPVLADSGIGVILDAYLLVPENATIRKEAVAVLQSLVAGLRSKECEEKAKQYRALFRGGQPGSLEENDQRTDLLKEIMKIVVDRAAEEHPEIDIDYRELLKIFSDS